MLETIAEPTLLGFSSGLACLAACGPVLLPWLAGAGSGLRDTAALLARFLAGRLLGYLVFACAAWTLGLALPLSARSNAFFFAGVHLALAAALFLFAVPARRPRPAACPGAARARRASPDGRFAFLAPLSLGFLTGLSLCPPFLVAGARAAQRPSLIGALGFFALFFAGTLAWFVPFVGSAALRRLPNVAPVARLAAAVVAAYYVYLGSVTLAGALVHA